MSDVTLLLISPFPNINGTLIPTVRTPLVYAVPTFRISKISTLTQKEFANQLIYAQVTFQVLQATHFELKDVIAKGGVVMTSCNCPKCSAMIDIPETGKVLICKYCGTPIKPIDIFEKIKSFIQIKLGSF